MNDMKDNYPEFIMIESSGISDYEYDFLEDKCCNPLFDRNTYKLKATINLRTGEVVDYNKNNIINGYSIVDIDNLKICDEGVYTLLDKDMNVISSYEGYVPNDVLPPMDGYGDYLTLRIDGKYITNLYDYEDMDFSYFEDDEDN